MFESFDFAALDDPSFKEDAVREEIIAPILRKIGYRPTGEIRVERSKTLIHPFVMIGSKKNSVNIVPDYTLFLDAKALMILDAKAPSEKITQSKHVEQAYSYAIHSEVRCDHYGLCNGRELIIYTIRQWEPLFHIDICEVDRRWEDVYKALHPQYLQMPELREFMSDFGLHATMAGIKQETLLLFADCPLQHIMKVRDDLYTAAASLADSEREYCMSFDFDSQLLEEILQGIPKNFSQSLLAQLSQQPFQAFVEGKISIAFSGHLGNITIGAYEKFVPVELEEIIQVNFEPQAKFTLKSSYTVSERVLQSLDNHNKHEELLFDLGQVFGTPAVLEVLEHNDVKLDEFIYRHATGDWGNIGNYYETELTNEEARQGAFATSDDAKLNSWGVKNNGQIMSAYTLADGIRIWIVTVSDRSYTCVCLPSEY